MRVFRVLMIISSLCGGSLATAEELLTNGTFEAPLAVGWEELSAGDGLTIERGTQIHPDPDYEARVYKTGGSGYGGLVQTMPLLDLDVEFSAYAHLEATATSTAWTVAALYVAYLDDQNDVVGETCISHRTRECPWESTPTFHIIEADPSDWQTYGFNISNELANLPGVDPEEVHAVRVSLWTYASNC